MLPEKKKIRKEVNVLFIAPDKVEEYWSLVDFMLREGLKYDGDPMNIKDLKEGLLEGAFQLFMMFGSDDGDKYTEHFVLLTIVRSKHYK